MDFVLLTFIGKFIFLMLNILISPTNSLLLLFLCLNHFHWILLKLIHFLDYFLSYLWSWRRNSNYWAFSRWSNIYTHDLKMLLMNTSSSSLTTIGSRAMMIWEFSFVHSCKMFICSIRPHLDWLGIKVLSIELFV